MKSDELFKFIETDLLPQCFDIMKTKGEAYSGLEDKLGNFKRIAKTLNLPVEQVWYVYFAKHMDALQSYLRGEYKDSESIKGRIQDLINYLFLLAGILKEQNKI